MRRRVCRKDRPGRRGRRRRSDGVLDADGIGESGDSGESTGPDDGGEGYEYGIRSPGCPGIGWRGPNGTAARRRSRPADADTLPVQPVHSWSHCIRGARASARTCRAAGAAGRHRSRRSPRVGKAYGTCRTGAVRRGGAGRTGVRCGRGPDSGPDTRPGDRGGCGAAGRGSASRSWAGACQRSRHRSRPSPGPQHSPHLAGSVPAGQRRTPARSPLRKASDLLVPAGRHVSDHKIAARPEPVQATVSISPPRNTTATPAAKRTPAPPHEGSSGRAHGRESGGSGSGRPTRPGERGERGAPAAARPGPSAGRPYRRYPQPLAAPAAAPCSTAEETERSRSHRYALLPL